MELRALTTAGIAEARRRLDLLRQGKVAPAEMSDLFRSRRWCRVFDDAISISAQDFRTRREAAEYFDRTFGHLRSRIFDHRGVWSFLGMYFLENTIRPEDRTPISPLDSCYLLDVGARATQMRYRHYLWGSWQLYEQHRDDAPFLLEQPLASWTNIAERAFKSIRIFNSQGVIPLIERLYVRGGRQKRGYDGGPGGLRHLVRVLNQLERTHDVYGDMSPDAILEILPAEFRAWDQK